MTSHVVATVRSCFASLRQIRSVRRSLPRHALLTVFRALVISRVAYRNFVLAGISGRLLARLQSVLNAAARLVFSLLHHCFANSTGCEYQSVLNSGCASWCTAVFRAQPRHTSRVVFTGPRRTLHVGVCAQQTPLRYSSRQLDAQLLGTVRSSWLRRGRGTHCHPPYVVPRH